VVFAYAYTIFIDAVCFLAFVVTMLPRFDTPKYRKCRAILYVIVGLSSALPSFHVLVDNTLYMYPFPGILWMLGGAFYITGATIYGLRLPERFVSGVFDYFGNSHNIFHFLYL
jgi:adiponectin receptor